MTDGFDTPTLAEMLTVLKKELALAQAISGPSEPAYRYLADPPANLVIQAYRQQRVAEAASGNSRPVFYVEVPPLFPGHPALIDVLSAALDLPTTGMRKDQFLSEERLADQLRALQVEFMILAHAHHLSSRPHAVEWLVMYCRRYFPYVPLVLVGEGKQMDDLLLWNATAWVVRRFDRIRLPGEAPESPQARGDLRRLLGRKDNDFFPEK